MAFLEIERTGMTSEQILERNRLALSRMTREELVRFVDEVHRTIHSVTPVWTGRTVANFTWSEGSPNNRSVDPVDDGPKGEGRRQQNQAISDATKDSLSYNPGEEIYLTNNAQYPDGSTYFDMEYGRLPTPGKSRVPARGIIRLATQRALNNMRQRRSRSRRRVR